MSVYGFTPLIMVPLLVFIHATTDSVRRYQILSFLHVGTRVVVHPLQEFDLKGFVAMTMELVE